MVQGKKLYEERRQGWIQAVTSQGIGKKKKIPLETWRKLNETSVYFNCETLSLYCFKQLFVMIVIKPKNIKRMTPSDP